MNHKALLLLLLSGLSLHAAESAQGSLLITRDLVQEALSRNPEIAYYEAEIEAARAGRRAAATRPRPELSVQFGTKRVKNTEGSDRGPVWLVSLNQSFEWPGRLSLRKAIADQDLALAELGLERYRNALSARVLLRALQLHQAATLTRACEEVHERINRLRETYLARDPAGPSALLETRSLEALERILDRRSKLASLKGTEALAELNQLRGLPLDAPARIETPDIHFTNTPEAAALLTRARTENFEYRTRILELRRLGFEARLARHERQPSFTVSPFLSQENAGGRETTAGLGLSIPLPAGGPQPHLAKAAAARQRQAEIALQSAERDLERQLVTQLERYRTLLPAAAPDQDMALSQLNEAAASAEEHLRLGALPVSSFVELQGKYLDAIEAILENRADLVETAITLEEISGQKLLSLSASAKVPTTEERGDK